MKPDYSVDIGELVKAYNLLVQGIDDRASQDGNRAYGGVIRAGKGKLVESITKHLVAIAWRELGADRDALEYSSRRIQVPIQRDYLTMLPHRIRQCIEEDIDNYFYNSKVDLHVHINGNLAIGVECKSYTENAMLKRILVDFMLIRSIHPEMKCALVQLESQLGGDYANIFNEMICGSPSTHTLQSYFPSVPLHIITLLEGERKVDKPIHKERYYKELKAASLRRAVDTLKRLLADFC